MSSPSTLPRSEALFERFCLPWYSPADLERRGHATVRPDVEVGVAPPRTPVGRLHAAPRESLHYVRLANQAVLARATQRFAIELGLEGAPDLDWVDAIDRAFDASSVAALIARADADARDNEYLTTAASVASVLGQVLLGRIPRAAWLLESPSWESAIYDHRSSSRVNVFHWALRRLSADALDLPLRAKLDEALATLDRAAGGGE